MFTIRHPYYEPKMWTYRHLLPIFILITLVEMFLATGDALWHNDKRTIGLARAGGSIGRMPVCLLVDAHKAVQLSAADYHRTWRDNMLFVGKLFLNLIRYSYLTALSADILP